jgi:hypothetical protein
MAMAGRTTVDMTEGPVGAWDSFTLGSTGESAQVQCAWCKRIGEFYFNHEQYDDRFPPFNWKQMRSYEPSTIVCNTCYDRGCPPHVKYLRWLESKAEGHRWFAGLGDQIELVAEFAYGQYAKYSPEQLAKMKADPRFNEDFPPGRKQSAMEMGRRILYGSDTIGESLNYVFNWLTQTCPICDGDRPFLRCNHRKPSMEIRGDRGVTLSFDDSSPNLRQVGMFHYCLHTGLRSIAERIDDIFNERVENLYFELDMNSAWQAAGFVDPEEQAAQEFMDRRHAARHRFPRRDIYFIEPGLDSRIQEFQQILSNFYAMNSILDTPPFEQCTNCGRPVNMVNAVNRRLTCSLCNRNTMCMGCANDGRYAFRPECYPCQFSYQGFRSSSSWERSQSLEHDILRMRQFHAGLEN